jgi:hypothetical protein
MLSVFLTSYCRVIAILPRNKKPLKIINKYLTKTSFFFSAFS